MQFTTASKKAHELGANAICMNTPKNQIKFFGIWKNNEDSSVVKVKGHLAHFQHPIPKNETPPRKKFLMFWEMELSSSCTKEILIFSYISGIRNPPKIFYISGNRNPKKLFIFQKM